jgi:hypothetical protein
VDDAERRMAEIETKLEDLMRLVEGLAKQQGSIAQTLEKVVNMLDDDPGDAVDAIHVDDADDSVGA